MKRKIGRFGLAACLGVVAAFYLAVLGEVLSRKRGTLTRIDRIVLPLIAAVSTAGTWWWGSNWAMVPVLAGAVIFGTRLRRYGHGGWRWS